MNLLKEIEKKIVSGRLDEAEQLTHALSIPETTKVAVLATIEMKRGNNQKAEVLFERVLSQDPNHLIAAGNLGQLLAAQGKFKRALPFCELAYKAALKNELYALNYAGCLAEADRIPDALAVLLPFVDSESPSLKILVSATAMYRANLQASEALLLLERAQSLYPDNPEVEKAAADVLAELDPKEASKAFRVAEGSATNKVALRWNWSFVELRLRNWRKGWELYENGLDEKVGKIGRPLPGLVRVFERVTNLNELDPDKWTLFVCEQGIGDQVLFLGCFRQVLSRFPKSLLICEERLAPLLQRSFPEVQVASFGFAYSISSQSRRLNGVFPIGSFQKDFRGSTKRFKDTRSAYLVPASPRVEKYRKLLEEKAGGRTIVGISWSGGHWDRQKKTKSYPFELFGGLMSNPKYCFVCLQYGDITKEKELSKSLNLPVIFIAGMDFKKDIDGWLALAFSCDRIISVSTALVHFAGAVGKRVDVLMGNTQGPFIWGLEDGPSVAYLDVHTWRRGSNEDAKSFFSRMENLLL